jgi:hypothetical protein
VHAGGIRADRVGAAAMARAPAAALPSAAHLPRRPDRLPADARRDAGHVHVGAAGRGARRGPRRHLPGPPVLALRAPARRPRHAQPRHRQPRLGVQEPLRLQPPVPAGPALRGRGRGAQGPRGRHVQHQPPLGGPVADPHVPPHPGPRGGPRRHAREAAVVRRSGRLPRGHHLPRAVPAAVQPAVRRARARRGARGAALVGRHVPRHHGGRVEGAGPTVPAHEPHAGVHRALLGHRRRRVRRPGGGARRGERAAAAHRGGARVHVHGAHEEGQVPHARWQRRNRRRQPRRRWRQEENYLCYLASSEFSLQAFTRFSE